MSSSCFSHPDLVNSDEEPSPPHSPTTTPTATAAAAITQTITRQLQTFASFLAPPPNQPYNPSSIPSVSDEFEDESSSGYKGIKKDLIEISGSLKTGLSLLSPKKAVSGILNFMQFDKDDDFEGVGINGGVVDFVKEVSFRPEYWIDFPLSLQNIDFNMSHIQKNHALAIQQVVPNLTTLRNTVQVHISEEKFWMIYFVLLLPRLNENDCRLLSSPQIVQVHETLMQKLKNANPPTRFQEDDTPYEKTSSSEKGSLVNTTKRETESSSETSNQPNTIKRENHEEYASSASETGDWVRLKKTSKANRSSYRERRSESSESSDWHAVEDADL